MQITWASAAGALMSAIAGVADASDSPVTKPQGFCERPDPKLALEELGDDIANAAEKALMPRKCVSEDDPKRESEEQRELQAIDAAVKAEVKNVCTANSCVSNLAKSLSWFTPWYGDTFGGCYAWADKAAEAIGTTSYYSRKTEQRCMVRSPSEYVPVPCHWVVVLRNNRTGEQTTVDAWDYAGGWGGARSESARAARSVLGDYDSFASKYTSKSTTFNRYKGRCPGPKGDL